MFVFGVRWLYTKKNIWSKLIACVFVLRLLFLPFRSIVYAELKHLILITPKALLSYWHFYTFNPVQILKGALSGMRQFLAIESPLKILKKAFYFTSKALFVLKIFKFLFWLFGHVTKQLDWKDKVNLKFFDVTAWLANNCNTHIAQYLEK